MADEVKFSGWRSGAGAVGRVVERVNDGWTLGAPNLPNCPNGADESCSYDLDSQVSTNLQRPDSLRPTGATMWAPSQSRSHSGGGARCWVGQERRRSEEAAGVVPTGELIQ